MFLAAYIFTNLSYPFRKLNSLNIYPLLKDIFFVHTFAEQLDSLNKFILSTLFSLRKAFLNPIIMRSYYIQIQYLATHQITHFLLCVLISH